jgi:hypothetical protein
MELAKALDDALFYFGRPKDVEEPVTTFSLRFALRRALCLAEACEGRIQWQSFVNACIHCLGSVEEWRGTEIGTALAAILRMDLCDETRNQEPGRESRVAGQRPAHAETRNQEPDSTQGEV